MSKSTYGSQRKRSRLSVPVMTLAILVLGLIGGALILHAGGVIEIPLLSKKSDAPAAPDYTGLVRLPVSTQLIPAYAEVTRNHISDQGGVATIYLHPDVLIEGMLTYEDLRQGNIAGRVLKRAKPPGYAFMDADFYPVGTRPGPTAGVPKGKRAMRLKASDVPGLHGLNQFDHFDLVMTVVVEVKDEPARRAQNEAHLDVDGPYSELAEGPPASATPAVRVKRKHAEVKTIVSNGLVVQPVTQRAQLGTSSSLLRGTSVTSMPVEEITIAVDPDEVAELNLALAIEAQLQVAMRSGQVSDDTTTECEIPDIELVLDQEEVAGDDEQGGVTHVKVVEVIKGSSKHLMAVPTTPKEEEPRED